MIGGTLILDYSLYIVNIKLEFYLQKGGKDVILQRVESLCKEKGISISRLEKDCSIGNATIKRWDESAPRIDTLKKVADYFGVSIEYFLKQCSK